MPYRSEFLKAQAMIDAGEAGAASEALSVLVTKKYAPAYTQLACLLALGKGVERDVQAALELLEQAVALGDPAAKALLPLVRKQEFEEVGRSLWQSMT